VVIRKASDQLVTVHLPAHANIRFSRYLFDDEVVRMEADKKFMLNAISAMVVLKKQSPVGSSSTEVAATATAASPASPAPTAPTASADCPGMAIEAGGTATKLADGSWICKSCSVCNPKPMGKTKTQEVM
jgi:hypothetical protein